MVTYTKPQQRKKEESERIRGERDQDSEKQDSEKQDSEKQEGGKKFHKLHVLGMNDDLWDGVRGLGSETLKGYE